MISNANKRIIANYIVNNGFNETNIPETGWNRELEFLDYEGNIWALTEDCKSYVKRLLKLKSLL